MFDCTVPNNTLSRAELSYDEGTVLNVHYGDVLIKYGSVLDVQKDDIPRIPHRCREDFNGALLQDGDVIIADTAEDETTGKACEIGNLQGSAIVSGLHTMVCRPRNRMALGYLGYYLNSNAYHHQLLPLMQGIKVLSLSRSNIQKTSVSYPIAVKEQQLIAYYFSQLDNLITLHQRQPFLHSTPEISLTVQLIHPFYTSSWEQRKFSELVQIERGGSPRPIDDFITDTPNGLNWIKIGDAPTQGNYITKTAEKIRPEGLSKTREVHPGDLILSNSMSFGKPYIMGIDGCIHDGWLLIRNTYGVFDLTFLCHLLGTPQMLSQYRSLAAGSTVNNLNKELVGNTVVTIPSITEQRVLGDYLEQLDSLITLHQREQNYKKEALMSYTLTKYEKETVLLYNQSHDPITISTYDPGLRRRLREFAARYPELCRRVDKQKYPDYAEYEIQKERVSIRLLPPMSEEKRRVASEKAKAAGLGTKGNA